MTKCALVFAAVASTLALLVGCGAPPPRAAAHGVLDEIATRGTIRVCSTGDYRPFTRRDAAGWSGLDIEMAQRLAKDLGVQLDLVQTTWATMISDLGAKCEMAMGGISITLDRAKHALYSTAYLDDGKAAIVRCADVARYRTLPDIDRPGVRVVVNPGGTNAEFDAANIHRASIVDYPDNNTIFDQVVNGRADVMITDVSEIRWQTTQNPLLCGPDVGHPFTFEQKAYLIPVNGQRLRDWVDQWLTVVQHDGTYSRIAREWLGGA